MSSNQGFVITLSHSAVTLTEVYSSTRFLHSGIDLLTDYLPVTVIGHSVGANDIGLQLTAFGGNQDVPFQRAM
jgi:hypothetical protein